MEILKKIEQAFRDLGATESAKRDYNQYDRKWIMLAKAQDFPIILQIGDYGTRCMGIGGYAAGFQKNEATRYDYIQCKGSPWSYYQQYSRGWRTLLIMPDKVTEIEAYQIQNVIDDVMLPVVKKWEAEHGALPRQVKMPVKLHGITLTQLKELIRECREHDDDSLLNVLKRFKNYKVTSSKDVVDVYWHPYDKEFGFAETCDERVRLVGGIIFHGWPETGYQTNHSVQIEPTYGWASHT